MPNIQVNYASKALAVLVHNPAVPEDVHRRLTAEGQNGRAKGWFRLLLGGGRGVQARPVLKHLLMCSKAVHVQARARHSR